MDLQINSHTFLCVLENSSRVQYPLNSIALNIILKRNKALPHTHTHTHEINDKEKQAKKNKKNKKKK